MYTTHVAYILIKRVEAEKLIENYIKYREQRINLQVPNYWVQCIVVKCSIAHKKEEV